MKCQAIAPAMWCPSRPQAKHGRATARQARIAAERRCLMAPIVLERSPWIRAPCRHSMSRRRMLRLISIRGHNCRRSPESQVYEGIRFSGASHVRATLVTLTVIEGTIQDIDLGPGRAEALAERTHKNLSRMELFNDHANQVAGTRAKITSSTGHADGPAGGGNARHRRRHERDSRRCLRAVSQDEKLPLASQRSAFS